MAKRRIPVLVMIPPLVFAGLAALFYVGMQREDPEGLPTAFKDKPAPALTAEALPGYAPLTDADLRTGEVTVVNFWASWCPPCRVEHPRLHELAGEGIRLYSVNFKDDAEDARNYLEDEGNPFAGIAFDPTGRMALDWGVAAPPETFVIDGQGRVVYRFAGPLVGAGYEKLFRPALDAALAGAD